MTIVILLFAFARPRTEIDYTHDLRIYDTEQMGTKRSPFTFVYNHTLGGYMLRGLDRHNRLPVSDSMVSIQISPSQPRIFGDEKDEDKNRVMKVVLTPPTPAKKEKMRPVSSFVRTEPFRMGRG
ncbi:hypothetical protein CC1G_11522 [Coprinopsis cinerea okayama7|uniref:Uncharacterized protein n=1 Tax=Coprinopsis cinerea (strain Okayama-7 / 130 / ATCC MYA-4618 / FGSC 9003) TaxID=240176 RepID=A8NHC6_COPC7|nr:hypothetical protein CC1G_11522 [Coprinopsis cinerea okayama7\|eukprot:XP_001833737.1 hypothetical protein CC1G_11522 [Coprinopsis cinerea okayama7\